MKRETIQNISCFVAGMSVAIILQFAIPQLFASFKHNGQPEPVVLNTTNVVESADTTYTNRPAKPNADWFKDNSNYIWENWKLR